MPPMLMMADRPLPLSYLTPLQLEQRQPRPMYMQCSDNTMQEVRAHNWERRADAAFV